MYDFKDDLIAGAYMIETETAGFLSAAGYMKVIEQGIAPMQQPGDSGVAVSQNRPSSQNE